MECDILTTALDNNDIATIDLLVSSGKYPLFKFVRIAEKWLKDKLAAGSNIHSRDLFEYKVSLWELNIYTPKFTRTSINLDSQVVVYVEYQLGRLSKYRINKHTLRNTNQYSLLKLLQTYGNTNYTLRTSLNYIYEQRYNRVI